MMTLQEEKTLAIPASIGVYTLEYKVRQNYGNCKGVFFNSIINNPNCYISIKVDTNEVARITNPFYFNSHRYLNSSKSAVLFNAGPNSTVTIEVFNPTSSATTWYFTFLYDNAIKEKYSYIESVEPVNTSLAGNYQTQYLVKQNKGKLSKIFYLFTGSTNANDVFIISVNGIDVFKGTSNNAIVPAFNSLLNFNELNVQAMQGSTVDISFTKAITGPPSFVNILFCYEQ